MAGGTAAAVVGGAGLVSGMMGNRQMARAAGQSAAAQAAAARQIAEYGRGVETRVNEMADMTPQELQAFTLSLDAAERTTQADMKLMDAIDPALMEASTQALQLLRGQDAQAIAPIRNQRQSQRDELVRTLRQQLGAGAETSSAGQRALRQFDMETSTFLNQVQQGTLQSFLGLGQSQRAQGVQNIGTLQNVGSAFGNVASRRANYALQAGQSTMNAMGGVMQTAGSPFVSAMVQGQGQQALGNQLFNLGGQMLGGDMFGGGGGGWGSGSGWGTQAGQNNRDMSNHS